MGPSNPPKAAIAAPVDPQYVQGSSADEVWAHFRTGAVVRALRDRTRHYPGLEGTAPSTISCYLRGEELKLPVNQVLDVGCGSGEGLRWLSRHYRNTIGLDVDGRALAFSRQIAHDSRLVQADIQSRVNLGGVTQLAYLIDVLAHLERPERALRILALHVAPPRGIIVAESAASPEQCLVPPARRAYSARSLHALLLRGGFIVEQWLSSKEPFLEVYAVALRDPGVGALADAESHFERGDFKVALELAQRAALTSVSGLRFEALLAQARLLIELGRRDEATALLLETRDLDPKDARPLAALSQLAMLARNDLQALAFAREAVKIDVLEVAGISALGALTREQDPRSSLDAWLVAHALAPDHSGVAFALCDAALALDDCALAITVLERLRRYAPKPSNANNSIALAWLLVRAGRPIQANLEARLAESLDPSSTELIELKRFLQQLSAS